MLKSMLLAGLATVAFVPSLVAAQSQCQDRRHDNRVVGTVIGAGLGALLGNAIGEHGGKSGGTIIGGVGGAVVGNSLAAGATHCGEANRYGYYDSNGQWIPSTQTAYGYYDSNGQWVATRASRYAPEPTPAPVYGEEHRNHDQWDNHGQWDNRGHDRWAGAGDVRAREDWLEQTIRQKAADGSLSRAEARRAMHRLNDIRRIDATYRDDEGQINDDQRADIQARLDGLRDRFLASADSERRSY